MELQYSQPYVKEVIRRQNGNDEGHSFRGTTGLAGLSERELRQSGELKQLTAVNRNRREKHQNAGKYSDDLLLEL